MSTSRVSIVKGDAGTSTARRIVVSMLTLGASKFGSLFLLQLTILMLIRAVGPTLAGRYNAALAITSSLSFLLGWGTSAALIRRGAVEPERTMAFARSAILVRLLGYGPFVVLVVGLAIGLGWTHEAIYLVAAASLVALGVSLQQIASALLELRHRFTTLSLAGALHGVVAAILIGVLVLWRGESLLSLLLAQGAADLLIVALWLRYLGVLRGKAPALGQTFPVVREAMPYVFAGVFYALNFRIDAVMIASMIGETAAGYYTSGSRVIMLGYMLPVVFSTVLRSRFFALASSAPREASKAYAQSSRFSAAVSLPVSVAFALVATGLVTFLFGERFLPGGDVLMILAPMIVLRALAVPACDIVTAFGRQSRRITIEALCAGSNVLLNLILIPIAGITGAAVATLCSEIFLVVWARAEAAALAETRFFAGLSLRPLAAAATTAFAITALRHVGSHSIVCLFGGAIAYACSAVPFGVIGAEDLRKL